MRLRSHTFLTMRNMKMEKIKITEQIAASIADMFLIPFLKSLKKREDGTYYSKELNRTYRVNDKGELEEIK